MWSWLVNHGIKGSNIFVLCTINCTVYLAIVHGSLLVLSVSSLLTQTFTVANNLEDFSITL